MQTHRHLTILFAEGEVLARNSIRTFRQTNYDVLVAATAFEAMEVSGGYKGTIDLLLSDLEMAGSSAFPLHRVIGAERPGIKILLIGNDFGESIPDSHPPAFLSKPFQLDALHARLKELLKRDTGTDENSKVILVVDGDPVRRERITRILSTSSYSVLTASSAAEAEEITDGISAIDLVIDSELISRLPDPLSPAALLWRVRRLLETR
jgi:DNA-binding response OmpR family regulator